MGIFSHTTINTVSILGCGWLGFALAQELLRQGYEVKGSTTTPDKIPMLREAGIKAFRIDLVPEPKGDRFREFLQADVLVVAIPPKVRGGMPDTFHPTQMKYLLEEVAQSGLSRILYISSTSVYPNVRRQVTENNAREHDPVSRALILAEQQFRQQPAVETTILRCGGLMGYDRVPGKYFEGKKNLATGNTPVNFIHRDDVVAIILDIIRQGKWNRTYNAVAPLHPTRREVYEQNARDFRFAAPTFEDQGEQPFKIVSAYKLMAELGYRFLYPNPMHFAYGPRAVHPDRSSSAPGSPLELPDIY
jgi:nucleoside-diphosphate-sugar epimerase